MTKVKNKHKAKLLAQIARDMEAATGMAHAASKAAVTRCDAGRFDEALIAILEAEPRLYDANKLMVLATYVNGIGTYGKERD